MSGPERSLVIVAGGRSRRLGRNKPLVRIGDRTVLSRILEATAHIGDAVLAVREAPPFADALSAAGWDPGPGGAGSPPGAIPLRDAGGRDLLVVPDPVPDLGPLAGFASGLGVARAPICVVLAGDLPFVTPELVDRLSGELVNDPRADAVVPHARGRAQPLCAAYRTEVGDLAAELVARAAPGGSSPSMMGFLEQLRVRRVAADDLEGIGDLETMVRGVDSRADLDWATRLAARTDASALE